MSLPDSKKHYQYLSVQHQQYQTNQSGMCKPQDTPAMYQNAQQVQLVQPLSMFASNKNPPHCVSSVNTRSSSALGNMRSDILYEQAKQKSIA